MMSGSRLSNFGVALFLCACGGEPVHDAAADLAQATPADGASPADLAIAPPTTYDHAGPDAFTTEKRSATAAGATFDVTIYAPSSPGPHPAVFVSPGFGQPAAGYVDYAERLASHGILTVLRDDPGFFTSSATAAAQLDALIATWLPSALPGVVALDRVGLLGHSRGGQVSLMSATSGSAGKVRAVFGLDPVDASQGGARARDALPGIGIPTAFLGETLDGTSALPFGMACAPAADNYQTLYAAAPSPSLLLTATGAGHFDFVHPGTAVGAGFCRRGAASGADVLSMAVTLSTAFFARELLGAPVGATLDATAFVATGALTIASK